MVFSLRVVTLLCVSMKILKFKLEAYTWVTATRPSNRPTLISKHDSEADLGARGLALSERRLLTKLTFTL